MSERDDDLELQAIQRELDDAFETTRPRRGFEDELWMRMQSRRPAANRLRDAIGGLFQGLRAVPAVPAAAVATLLVVVIGVGVLALSGAHVGGGGNASSGSAPLSLSQQRNQGGSSTAYGPFGRLPSPQFSSSGKTVAPTIGPPMAPANAGVFPYYGPAALTWTGRWNITIVSAPVLRYHEPSTITADQFASALGAVLTGRPAGFLGSYESSDYTLKVRGTVQSPPQGPAYFILSTPSLPAISAAGAAPADIALLFLAEHSLVPEWPYTTEMGVTGGLTRVRLLRQFVVPQYDGTANLVDVNGDRYGLEVFLDGNRPVLASGPLPVNTDAADYPIVSADQAIRSAVTSSPAPAAGALAPVPAVQLNHVELVYVLVPAGDHSFYEPAFLFSGTFQVQGVTYVKRVLVPAVDPSERS
jgi:hypothetical protein